MILWFGIKAEGSEQVHLCKFSEELSFHSGSAIEFDQTFKIPAFSLTVLPLSIKIYVSFLKEVRHALIMCIFFFLQLIDFHWN